MRLQRGWLILTLATMTLGIFAAHAGTAQAASAEDNYQTLCVKCHGQDGSGNGPAAAVLEKHPASFTDCATMKTRSRDYLVKIVTEGGSAVDKSPQMPPNAKKLTSEEISAVVDYLTSKFCQK